jgi:hypothetical protein
MSDTQELQQISLLLLWSIGFFAFLYIVRFNGRRFWQHGGSRFVKKTSISTKLVFVGTATCLYATFYGVTNLTPAEGFAQVFIASAVTVVGLLGLCPASMSTWRDVLRDLSKEEEDKNSQPKPILESDVPIDNPEFATDQLRDVANRLSFLLRNADTSIPLVIAVTGKWGSGKSSLMRMAQRDVSRAEFPCVWFNAWHHQRETYLFAALMEAIRSGVERWSTSSYLEFRFNLARIRIGKERARFGAFLAGSVLFFLGLYLALGVFAAQYYVGGAGLALSILSLYRLSDSYRLFCKIFGIAPATSLLGAARLARFEDRLGFRHKFGTAFGDVCRASGVDVS